MSLRRSRVYRSILLGLSVVFLVATGFLAYRSFFAPVSVEKQLRAAEAAYARGVAAYEARTWDAAATRFDEAGLLVEKGMEILAKQATEGRLPPDEVKALYGRLMWVKARAVRDRAHARAQAEDKPIGDVTDAQYGETYRGVMTIPDTDTRAEALASLRLAALYLRADRDVIKEALRAELVRSPIDWGTAEPLLRTALEMNPRDARAHYFLAKFEYDQPNEDTGAPTRADKKAAARIEKARTHLAAARESGAPHWRVVGMEAEILRWEVRTAAARKAKANALATAEQALDRLLFEPPGGAVEQISRGEHLAGLGRADVSGLVSVLSSGLDRAMTHARKPDGRPDRVRAVLRAAIDLANATAGNAAAAPFLPEIAVAAVDLTWQAQALLAVADATGWRDAVAGLETVLAKAGDAARTRPQVRLQLAQITYRDSLIATRSNDFTLAKELAARAIKQAEEGLAAAEKATPNSTMLDEYRLALAEWRLLGGARADDVRPFLNRVRTSAVPRVKLTAQVLDAVIAERQGRLDEARKILRPVTTDRNHPELAFRASLMTATLALTSGDPSAALTALREVEPVYQKLDELPPTERAWAAEYIRGRDEVTALQVGATLEIALQAGQRFRRDNPGRPVPTELLASHEATAEGLMKKIKPPSPADRTARLAAAGYLALTGRRKLAETRLAELTTDYPSSLEVLRARTSLLAVPETPTSPLDPNAIAAGDVLVRKFLKDYPADRLAKLYWAEWLVRTSRADQAIEYLRDPGTFLGGRDDAVDRALAAALYQLGLRDEARRLLGRLPDDPAVTAILIRSAGSLEASEAQLKEALSRFENKGLFQVYQGSALLGQRKFPEAAAEFAAACAVTQVRPAARAGLTWALTAYTSADPTAARELAVKLAGEMPDEPSVYLAAALAALRLDDVGTPTDNWDQARTMYAAVNRWVAVAGKAGLSRADAVVAATEFKLLAGDPVGARRDAVASYSQSPTHAPTLILLADLFLSPPADLTRARDFYQQAVRVNAADPRLPYLDARIRQADGDWAGAAAVYDRLVAESPRNPTPYPPLIAALGAAGKKGEALRRARDWHARMPDDDRAAVTLIQLVAASGAGPEAAKLADEFVAREAAAAGKRAAVIARPGSPAEADAAEKARLAALQDVAAAFFRAGALDEATARAREVLKARSTDERARMVLGGVAVSRGEWEAAAAIYQDVLKENPRAFVAGNNLAWILAEKKNDPAGAMQWVERVRRGPTGTRPISPERLPPDFLDTLGVVYRKLNHPDRYREMQAVFEAAAKRYPADPRMLLYLGQAQAATGEKARGLETLEAAIQLAKTRNGLTDQQNKEVIEAAEAARARLRG